MSNRAAQRRKASAAKPKKSGRKGFSKAWKSWQEGKSPILIFLLKFCAVLIPFYIVWNTAFFKDYILYSWNALNTAVASFVLNIFGAGTRAIGDNLMGPNTSIQVFEGCDGIEPTMLLVAGIVAFPAEKRHKMRGILFGSLFILTVNFVRIISLYVVRVNWPSGFDFMHLDFWQVLFILLALVTWGVWIQKSKPKNTSAHEEVPA